MSNFQYLLNFLYEASYLALAALRKIILDRQVFASSDLIIPSPPSGTIHVKRKGGYCDSVSGKRSHISLSLSKRDQSLTSYIFRNLYIYPIQRSFSLSQSQVKSVISKSCASVYLSILLYTIPLSPHFHPYDILSLNSHISYIFLLRIRKNPSVESLSLGK